MFRLFFVFIEKSFHLDNFRKTLSLVGFNYTNQTVPNDGTDSSFHCVPFGTTPPFVEVHWKHPSSRTKRSGVRELHHKSDFVIGNVTKWSEEFPVNFVISNGTKRIKESPNIPLRVFLQISIKDL